MLRIVPLLSLILILSTGCTLFETSSHSQSSSRSLTSSGVENNFNPPGQLTFSDNVYSIQLHRKSSPGSAPFIQLNSNQQLRLRFETLGFSSRQFRVRFTHHNPDWTNSGLPPEFFLEGFQTIYMTGGVRSRNTQISYQQFNLEFPNNDISFKHSGNFMLHIEDTDSGNLLFTLPFFIYENRGSVTSHVETQITPRQNLRITHHPVSRYNLPEDINQPQFDLEFYYVQNRFWGKMKRAVELDFSAPDHVQFETSRENNFTGDYEFRTLSFREISQTEQQISEVDLSESFPLVILNDDAEGFSGFQGLNNIGRTGNPDYNLSARYANVFFRFDHQQNLPDNSEIYLVGDFNQWAVQTDNRMQYQENIDRWETSVIMKPGRYHYKYVVLHDNRIHDLIFDDRFSTGLQEYHALVYMRDQTRQTYRLLQINHFFKDEQEASKF